MSALTVVQAVCTELGLAVPNAVVSSSDPQIKQILSLANRSGKELAIRYNWSALTRYAAFTTVNTSSQGSIETLAPGYRKIVNQTIWDRSLDKPVFGPNTPTAWAAMLAGGVSSASSQYRVMGGQLVVIPAPLDGQEWAFEFISKNWVSDGAKTTTRDTYQADDDYSLLDEDVIILATIWRWLQRKGFSYSEDFAEYERRVATMQASDGTKPILHVGGTPAGAGIAQEGSWGAGSWNV